MEKESSIPETPWSSTSFYCAICTLIPPPGLNNYCYKPGVSSSTNSDRSVYGQFCCTSTPSDTLQKKEF